MELISSIQSYAQEFLKYEKNSSSIIEAMSQLEILDKKNSILFILKWEKFYLFYLVYLSSSPASVTQDNIGLF